MAAEVFIAIGVWAIVVIIFVLAIYIARLGQRIEILAQNMDRTINEVAQSVSELNRSLPTIVGKTLNTLGSVDEAAQQISDAASSVRTLISGIAGIQRFFEKPFFPRAAATISGIIQGIMLARKLFQRRKKEKTE